MEDIERLGRLTLQSPCKQVLSAKQQRSANNSASNGASVSSKSVSLKLDSTKQPNTALKQDKQGKQQTTPKTPNRFTPKKLNTSVTSTGSRLFDKEDKENSKQTPMKQIDLRLRYYKPHL